MSKAHLRSLFEWGPFCSYLSTLTEARPTHKLLRSYSTCRAEHVSLGLQKCSHAKSERRCALDMVRVRDRYKGWG